MSLKTILVHAPIANNIASNMNYISRLSLCQIYPWIKSKISGEFIDFRSIVKQNLVDLIRLSGENFEKIKNTPRIAEEILISMERSLSFMSGSFVLKCLIDTPGTKSNLEVGDIDLFTTNYHQTYISTTRKQRHPYKRGIELPITQHYVSVFSNTIYKSSVDVFDIQKSEEGTRRGFRDPYVKHRNVNAERLFGETLPEKLLWIRDFWINELKIQDIVIREVFVNVPEFIEKTFDMDFLKNTFDGRTLRILNPTAVLKRKATVNMFHSYFKGFVLLRGYEEPENGAENRERYIKRQYKRLEKYRARGFKVDVDYSKDIPKVVELCQAIYPEMTREKIIEHILFWDEFISKVDDNPKSSGESADWESDDLKSDEMEWESGESEVDDKGNTYKRIKIV